METIPVSAVAIMDEFKKIIEKYQDDDVMMAKIMMVVTKIIPNTLSKCEPMSEETKIKLIKANELGATFISKFRMKLRFIKLLLRTMFLMHVIFICLIQVRSKCY